MADDMEDRSQFAKQKIARDAIRDREPPYPELGGTTNLVVGNDEQDEPAFRFGELGLVARSKCMLDVLQQAWKASQAADASLLIEGATGTGKSVLAEAIHRLDLERGGHPFVTISCSAIQPSVAESELFGHERGAFSGAAEERKGLFRAAHRGTAFLDDVGDLPLGLQPKLLDVLQRRVVRSVGSDREHSIDVRVIAASNEPLEALVAQGRFRADLYYRLDVVRLRLPALRERPDDVGPLVLALAGRHRRMYEPITEVEPALEDRLRMLPFPGNVRELEHLVRRMLFAKRRGTSLGLEDLPAVVPNGWNADRHCDEAAASIWRAIASGVMSYKDALRRMEWTLLHTATLAGPARTRREVAATLQMGERTLYRKIRQLSDPRAIRCAESSTDSSGRLIAVPGGQGQCRVGRE